MVEIEKSRRVSRFVYVMTCDDVSKVGITYTLRRRRGQIAAYGFSAVSVVRAWEVGERAVDVEREVVRLLSEACVSGREYFNLPAETVIATVERAIKRLNLLPKKVKKLPKSHDWSQYYAAWERIHQAVAEIPEAEIVAWIKHNEAYLSKRALETP